MSFFGQKVIPAIRKMEDIERVMKSKYQYIAILEIHVARLRPILKLAKSYDKKVILHLDLIQGLKNDEYATEFICQEFKPFGIISTKGNAITKAKNKGVVSIERMFLIDSSSIERNISLIERTQPDYIEVLPGILPKVIKYIKKRTDIDIIAGGLIETVDEVHQAHDAGAISITTSDKILLDHFEPK